MPTLLGVKSKSFTTFFTKVFIYFAVGQAVGFEVVGVSRGYTDHHQGRAIHMADSRIH